MKHSRTILSKCLMFVLMAALAAFPLIGCAGSKGDSGSKGKAGTSKGTLSGTVTNNITTTPVSDVSVALDPDLGMTITTDNSGNYSASLPAGNYTVTYSKSGFSSQSKSFSILAGVTSDGDVALVPTANVIVDAGADTSAAPGGSVSPTATSEPLDGSTCTAYSWTQTAGATAVITNGTSATPIITLASAENYKTELYTHLEDLNRTMVQGLNHLAVEESETATFMVTVTCGSSTYSDSVDITASVPWLANPGIRNVAKNVPVLLHARDMGDSTWTWTLDTTDVPTSTASFDNANSRNPVFTPDVVGHYQASVTNGTDTDTLDIYAGTWEGVMGTDNGLSSECTLCHYSGAGGDEETVYDTMQEWQDSGHSEIMSQNLDTDGGHWSLSCAGCHTVGYNTDADNNGFDEVATAEGWSPPAHGEEGTWAAMLADSSLVETVQRSNIQCENCHGPNTAGTGVNRVHNNGTLMDTARVSLSSDVCGSCHGEPARHARYQQWQESGHGDTNFATDESVGSDGYARSCAPCHSGNGFIAWGETSNPYGPDMDNEIITIVNASAAAGELKNIIVSQTCQACHDPHDPGNMSGEPNNAKVRVSGTTPETKGGFIAANVGRGAVCMMCHNSRRGPYNTSLHPDYFNGNAEMNDETPHHGPQSDVLMGENGFFVGTGQRSPHSYIVDTCTTCHMELTNPPAEYSYNLSGTNHTFAASLDICSECHGTFDGGTLQASVQTLLDTLETGLTNALIGEINQIAADVDAGPGSGHLNGVLIDYDSATLTAADIVNTTDLVTAVTTSSRGRFNITVDAHSAVSSVNLSDIVVWIDTDDSGDITDAGEIFTGDTNGEGIVDSAIDGVATNGQTIAKANWNFVLITEDGSLGIHNPGFVHDVLQNTISALNAL